MDIIFKNVLISHREQKLNKKKSYNDNIIEAAVRRFYAK